MTIYIPKKPFMYIGFGIFYCMIFLWIISFPLAYLNYTKIYKFGDPDVELAASIMSLVATLVFLYDQNEKKHWIKWRESKESST